MNGDDWSPSRNAWCAAQAHFQVNLTGDRLTIREKGVYDASD